MSTKGKVSIALFVGGAFFAGVLFATVGADLFGAGNLVGTSGQAATLDGSTAIEQEAAPTGPNDDNVMGKYHGICAGMCGRRCDERAVARDGEVPFGGGAVSTPPMITA